MKVMKLRYSNKKKVRGARRKCLLMIEKINSLTNNYPDTKIYDEYWHMHLPVAQAFINSNKTPTYVRKECMQSLLNRAKHLSEIKSNLDVKNRVTVCISLPNIWDSQIIVFIDENYYNDFFYRNNDFQKWTPLSENRSLSKVRNLMVPEGFQEKGYIEEIFDEDFNVVSELWFFGELL